MIVTISNLYPRPDQPRRGMYNAQLFSELSRLEVVRNICLVPSWNLRYFKQIKKWRSPFDSNVNTSYLPVFYLPVLGRSLNWLTYALSLNSLKFDKDKITKILGTWLYPDGVVASQLGRKLNKPVWIKLHGSDAFHLDNPVRRKVVQNRCSNVKGYICVSQNLVDKLETYNLLNCPAHILSNGINREKFYYRPKNEAKKMIGIDQKKKLVIQVGNLVAIKGPEILLRAWKILLDRLNIEEVPNYKLVYIGDGSLRKQIISISKEFGIEKNVSLAGSISHNEVPLWMSASDCLVLSSLSEGMPNVILEAMATGVPIISTKVGACEELLKDYPLADVIPPSDPQKMASALDKIMINVGERGKNIGYSLKIPSWADQAKKLFEIMK